MDSSIIMLNPTEGEAIEELIVAKLFASEEEQEVVDVARLEEERFILRRERC